MLYLAILHYSLARNASVRYLVMLPQYWRSSKPTERAHKNPAPTNAKCIIRTRHTSTMRKNFSEHLNAVGAGVYQEKIKVTATKLK